MKAASYLFTSTKWWFVEAFAQDIIKLIDKNLSLERIYNIKQTTSREALESILEKLGEVTSESELDNARMEAANKVTIYYVQQRRTQIVNGRRRRISTKPQQRSWRSSLFCRCVH